MKKNRYLMFLNKFFRAQSTIFNWLGARFFPKQGFFIPYRYAQGVKPTEESSDCSWLKEEFDKNSAEFISLLTKASRYNDDFAKFYSENKENINQPRFNQEWFSGLDGAMAYAMVREHKPANIIEIGSGHSTRFLAQAIVDGKIDCHLHSIDPKPRREIDKICDQISRHTVTQVSIETLTELQEDDILFIDCSHIFVDGTDVDYLFTQVLSQLTSGVYIHIHDIFLPNGYPEKWTWRGYNEQNVLLAMLGAKGRYQVICPNAYLRRYHNEAVDKLNIKLNNNTFEASFWLKII